MKKGQLLLTDQGLKILHHISMAIIKLNIIINTASFSQEVIFLSNFIKKVVSTLTFMSA